LKKNVVTATAPAPALVCTSVMDGESPINLTFDGDRSLKVSLANPKFTGFNKAHEFERHVDEATATTERSARFNISARDVAPTVLLDGEIYRLIQFHFHSPSEHTIEGKQTPLEGHFVFKSDRKTFAVVGILFNLGKGSKVMDQVVKLARGEQDKKAKISLQPFFAHSQKTFRYWGSLTTKPYMKGIKWTVYQKEMTVSKKQLEELEALHMINETRGVQQMNTRALLVDVEKPKPPKAKNVATADAHNNAAEEKQAEAPAAAK